MKFAFSWLKDLSGYEGSAEKLAELLSVHAFEAEVVRGEEFKNIIVAKVVKVDKHPNADRLRIAELTDGSSTYEPVVCGAWNFEAGALVPLALPGATIPHDQHDPEGKPFVLTKATIRGIESQGMICSGKELGLSDDGKGIMILDSDYKLGETFSPKTGELYLDISLPANRPDLLGYNGIAREISALANTKLQVRKPRLDLSKLKPGNLKVHIANDKLCPRYIAVKLTHLEVGPSPDFIQDRIRLSGHKPINNIVDITNYVMLETGQPLHAFDAGKIMGGIYVRNAYLNEKIITLDGEERQLSSQNLVIADSKRAVAVAGVMGGANTMIDEFTSEIILEAANFDSVSVRKTSREVGVRTDASSRYEKSLPILMTDYAAAYAVELLGKYAMALPVEAAKAGAKLPPAKRIPVDPIKINQLLGTKTKFLEQKQILSKFGFKTQGQPDQFTVVVPFDRPDVKIWQDLAEEIGRYTGLDKIDPVPALAIPSFEMTDPLVDARFDTAAILVGLGFSEIYTYSFVSEKELKDWDIARKMAIKVANPLNTDQEFMRPNILMNMMKTAEHNSRTESKGDYFEIGNIYWRENDKIIERPYLGIFSFDKEYPTMRVTSAFRELCLRLNVNPVIDQDSEQLASIKFGKDTIGHIGRVDVGELKWVGIHLDFQSLLKKVKPKNFQAPAKYPKKTLDVAVWARRDLPWSKIEEIISSVDSQIIRDIELFDIYTGKNVPMHKKSLAFSIVYQSSDKTLTDEEVEKVHLEVLKELKARLNLEVR